MIINTITVSNCQPQTIVIGRRGTYDTMQIAFDLSYLVESYGNGVAVLAVKRSQDTSAYPTVTSQEDDLLLWTVSETDTHYVGSGECQLMWYVDGGLAKTIIYPMVVMRDILATAEEPPDGYQTWVDTLVAEGAKTLQNAQNAAQSASDAEDAKDDTVAAKGAAEAAQQAAETAVTHYPKIENNYWMVWDSTSQSYVSTGIQAEGEDGYSPEVTITSITGGHRVTITDKDHPQGQSFDVMDGQGGGGTSDYSDLTNKPSINNVTLSGNKTAADLGLATPSDIPTDAGDIGYDDSETYQAGSVGAELQEQNRQLSDLEDTVSTTQIINTASGAIASFSDGADGMPIKKLVAQIEPVQDLHGYDHPWPGGGGKNKLQVTANTQTVSGVNFTVNADGTISATGQASEDIVLIVGAVVSDGSSYIGSGCPAGGNVRQTYGMFFNYLGGESGGGTGGAVVSSGSNIAANIVIKAGYTASNLVFKPMIRLATETDATFAPYSNICPISGWTGAEIEQTGVNVWDEEWELGAYDDQGNKYPGTSQIRNKNIIRVLPGTTYYYKSTTVSGNTTRFFYDENKQFISRIVGARNGTFTTPANAYYMNFIEGESYGTTYNHDISINYPATDTTYSPYTGNQISVNWEDEAGTVYGGTLTLNPDRTGTLVVDMAEAVYTGDASENWLYRETSDGHWRFFNANGKMIGAVPVSTDGAIMDAISNQYKFISRSATYYRAEGIGIAAVNTTALYLYDEQFTTVAELTTYLATHNLKVVYPLAEPQTYQLTAEQVSGILETLYGINNIWSSTGDTEVEYPCDTKLYIDGKLAELQATILENIGG